MSSSAMTPWKRDFMIPCSFMRTLGRWSRRQVFLLGKLEVGFFSGGGLGREGTSESGVTVICGGGSLSRGVGTAGALGRIGTLGCEARASGGYEEKPPRDAICETGPGSGVVKWVTTRR